MKTSEFDSKHTQMENYYQRRPGRNSLVTAENEIPEKANTILSEYDRYRQSLIQKDDNEGWASELRRYLKDRPADVTKDTDIVHWWQVCSFHCFILSNQTNLVSDYKEHALLYLTLA
jgi:hypothetical protein